MIDWVGGPEGTLKRNVESEIFSTDFQQRSLRIGNMDQRGILEIRNVNKLVTAE